eukprot:7863004-Pyramimonas_sp.AAC.1
MDEASDLGTKAFELSELLRYRHDVIENLKSNFDAYLGPDATVDKRTIEILKTAPAPLLPRMLTMHFPGVISNMSTTPALAGALAKSLSTAACVTDEGVDVFGLNLVRADLAGQVQGKVIWVVNVRFQAFAMPACAVGSAYSLPPCPSSLMEVMVKGDGPLGGLLCRCRGFLARLEAT